LGCSDVTIKDSQVILDSTSLAQDALVRQATRRLVRISPSYAKYVKKIRARSRALHNENWGIIWSIPQVITQCSNLTFCINKDNSSSKSTFAQNSEQHLGLATLVLRKIAAASSGKSKGPLLARAQRLHQLNLQELEKIPDTFSACT